MFENTRCRLFVCSNRNSNSCQTHSMLSARPCPSVQRSLTFMLLVCLCVCRRVMTSWEAPGPRCWWCPCTLMTPTGHQPLTLTSTTCTTQTVRAARGSLHHFPCIIPVIWRRGLLLFGLGSDWVATQLAQAGTRQIGAVQTACSASRMAQSSHRHGGHLLLAVG